jgi:hypothetical protein
MLSTYLLLLYDVQYVAATYGSKINWISIFANHKWVTRVLNALIFMFLGIHFFFKCGFVNLLLKLNIYVFSSRFKEFRNLENDISSFFLNLSNIEIYVLLVYGIVVVKMDNSHLFEMFLKFLFHT